MAVSIRTYQRKIAALELALEEARAPTDTSVISNLAARCDAAEARCDVAEQALIAANQAADQKAQEHREQLNAQRDRTGALEKELARANAEIDDLKCRLAEAEVLSQRAAGFIDRVHEEDLLKRQGAIEPADLRGPGRNTAAMIMTPTVFTEGDGYGHRRERAVRWPNFGGHRA